MKKIIAITALALAGFATTASAMTLNDVNTTSDIQRFVPGADIASLSDLDILLIRNAIHSGGSHGEIRSVVKSLVMQASS